MKRQFDVVNLEGVRIPTRCAQPKPRRGVTLQAGV